MGSLCCSLPSDRGEQELMLHLSPSLLAPVYISGTVPLMHKCECQAVGRKQRAVPVPCVGGQPWANVSTRKRWAELWQLGLGLMCHFSSVSTCLGGIGFALTIPASKKTSLLLAFLPCLFALWCLGVIGDKFLSFGLLIQGFLVLPVFYSWLWHYRSTWTGALGWGLAWLDLPALTT